MLSKSILAAATLAGASAVTAFEHPNFGQGNHNPCATTSTVIVYATETATVYAGGDGGWGASGANSGASATSTGGATTKPATVTVTATISVDDAGHTWGGSVGGGSTAAGSSTSIAGAASSAWGVGGGSTGSGSSTSVASAASSAWGVGGGSSTVSTTTTASGTASSSVSAIPTSEALCLNNATATFLTNGYGQLLSAYTNATANSLLAADFTDTSDSINWLAGIPLGGATFGSKAAFIAGQGSQPAIGFSVQSIMFSCTQVAFRWTASVGLRKFPAKGINFFTASNLNNSEAGWQIQTMFSEFNVGAWETDIGRTCAPQGANIASS